MSVEYTDLPDYLTFWHPVLDTEVDDDYLDWGQVVPGSSADRRIRVKNMSDDEWAYAVYVQPQDPEQVAGGAPLPAMRLPPQHWLSLDGVTFARAITVGDLPPSGISEPFVLRRVTDPGADVGESMFLLTATATEWGR